MAAAPPSSRWRCDTCGTCDLRHLWDVWHYLPKRWCADAACDFYTKVLAPSLRRNHPEKTSFRVLEDNDPTGYKANKAIECKPRP